MRDKLIGAVVGVAAGLLLGAAPAVTRCTTTKACLQVIQEAQQDVHTLAAEFVQVKHVSLLDEPLVSSGRFIFKMPDRILLRIEQPQPLTVTIQGRDVHIPNLPERERQALGMVPMTAMFTQLSAIFSGSLQAVEQGFEVSAAQEDTAIQVDLVPRQEAWKRVFRAIHLRFAEPGLFAQQIRLDDALGDSLEITLRDVQRNIDIPDSMFDVATPPAEGSDRK
jgi:outer membrane lipoprotein-sorting protein